MFFYIRAFRCACECTWKYRSISNNSPAQLEIKESLIACGIIHEGHEWFSDDSRERQEIFMCLAAQLCEQFCRFANEGAKRWLVHDPKISIKSYFIESFFVLSVFSSSEVLAKKLLPFGVNCRLQLANCLGEKREETVKPTCFMSKASSVRQIIHSILRPLRR